MVNTMKKRIIIYFTLLLLYIIFVLLAIINIDNISPVNSSSVNKPIIIIDAGHGGEDGGAVANNVVEKDINLKIALKLKDVFKTAGFEVGLTRNKDVMINSEGTSLRERKVSDMKNRLSIYNENNNNIVISIHQNKYNIEKYNGTQVFYSINNKNSKYLAECIKDNIHNLIQPYNNREIKPCGRNIYLLYNSKVPSVIVECGFISNINEANKLIQDEYQKEIVFAIYSGFLKYFNS